MLEPEVGVCVTRRLSPSRGTYSEVEEGEGAAAAVEEGGDVRMEREDGGMRRAVASECERRRGEVTAL